MKSLKSLRKGASKRMEMKNADGSPIHYDQKDEAPVFEAQGVERLMRKYVPGYGRGAASDSAAYHDWESDYGSEANKKRHTKAADKASTLGYGKAKQKGLRVETLSPERAKEAQAKAGYEASLAASAAKAGVKSAAQKHENKSSRYSRLLKPTVPEPMGVHEEVISEHKKGDKVVIGLSPVTGSSTRGTVHSELRWGNGESDSHGTHVPNGPYHKVKTRLGIFNVHPDRIYPIKEEIITSLEQLAPIFEALADTTRSMNLKSGIHKEIDMHAKAMSRHMALSKSEPHNLSHKAKISDYHDNIAKKHGHEAARYTHIAAQAYAAGNEHGAQATVKGAVKHAAEHHGLSEDKKLSSVSHLQSNKGFKRWRKDNGPPDHKESPPTPAPDNKTFSTESKKMEDLPRFAHAGAAHEIVNRLAQKIRFEGGKYTEADHNKIRNDVIDRHYHKLKAAGKIKEALEHKGAHHTDCPACKEAMSSMIGRGAQPHEAVEELKRRHASHAKKSTSPIKEGKVPDWLKTAARDSLKKQGYKVDMQLRTAKKGKNWSAAVDSWRGKKSMVNPVQKEEVVNELKKTTVQSFIGKQIDRAIKSGKMRDAYPQGSAAWSYHHEKNRKAALSALRGGANIAARNEETVQEGLFGKTFKKHEDFMAHAKKLGLHTQDSHANKFAPSHVKSRQGVVNHYTTAHHPKTGKMVGSFNHDSGEGSLPNHVKEDFILEAGKVSKTNMKRKYLGKTKGRTALGTPAHAVDTEPTLNIKDTPNMKINRFPTPSKGI